MKKTLLTLTVCLFSMNLFSQEKATISKSSTTKVNDSILERPADFPKYIDTGNSVEDEKNYRLAKEKYMLDHYGTDKNKNEQTSQVPNKSVRDRNIVQTAKNIDEKGRKVISKEEFEFYPQEKKDAILAQPEKFIIQ